MALAFSRRLSRASIAKAIAFSAVALGLGSCAATPEGNVTIVTGEETDTFSRAPAPVLLITEKIALEGTRTEINRTNLPTDTINLGELPRTEIGGIAVRGLDAAGKPLVRGETLFVQWGALEGGGLEVFTQRTGEFARMPRGPAAMDLSTATMILGRYMFLTSGTSSLLYDLLMLRVLSSPPILPRAPKSVGTFTSAVVLIDEAGATVFDLSSGSTIALEAPTGGTFAEIAGGQRIAAADGSQFIVGATRAVGSGGPTSRILLINPDGKATFASLTAPREGACATYVEGRGLVVYGGDAVAPGAELLATGGTIAASLPFPPDAVKGCGAASLDNQHVAIVGGTGALGDTGTGLPMRVIDLACTQSCGGAPWKDLIVLPRASAYALAPDAAFVVGDDGAGATHAFRVTPTELREVPLKIPRRSARLIPTPLSGFAVVGGGAPGIEQYLE